MSDKVILDFEEGDTIIFNGREMKLAGIVIGRTYGRMYLRDGDLSVSGDVTDLLEIGLDVDTSLELKND